MRTLSIGAVAVGLVMALLAASEAAARDRCDCGYFEPPFTGRYWRGQPAYRYLARARVHRIMRSDTAMPPRVDNAAGRPYQPGRTAAPASFGR